jgi:hypothetical protein
LQPIQDSKFDDLWNKEHIDSDAIFEDEEEEEESKSD